MPGAIAAQGGAQEALSKDEIMQQFEEDLRAIMDEAEKEGEGEEEEEGREEGEEEGETKLAPSETILVAEEEGRQAIRGMAYMFSQLLQPVTSTQTTQETTQTQPQPQPQTQTETQTTTTETEKAKAENLEGETQGQLTEEEREKFRDLPERLMGLTVAEVDELGLRLKSRLDFEDPEQGTPQNLLRLVGHILLEEGLESSQQREDNKTDIEITTSSASSGDKQHS
jgi:hypothetical protein